MRTRIYTVESVTCGHPDKVCDQISDAVLDECLRQDKNSRVAVETFGGHGLLVVCGEVTTSAVFDAEQIARGVYRDIGYSDDLRVITNIVRQSPDIAQGVNSGGAGDQGIMYGYATDETPEFLPKGVVLAHALTRGLEHLRRSGALPWLGPDGKAQVTVEAGAVRTVLVSAQHAAETPFEELKQALIEKLISPLLSAHNLEIFINPTGAFTVGGFAADTGLTGRKLMVDTYGGILPHGGGCFSGKDPTKVDRSAAYMARFAAKNLVAGGFAKRSLVSVAYAIGRAEPLMVHAIDEEGRDIGHIARRNFDFRPLAIIERLQLREPRYRKTAVYGHFGRNEFPWEEIVRIA
jgi:S-adenosylmethionine synthetase